MKPPSITVLFTLNNRPHEAMHKVFDSLQGQGQDETIIVLDQPEPGVAEYAREYWGTTAKFVRIDRAPGWICPARAWNMGFNHVTTEMVYCISSETIQDFGNVDKARELLSGPPCVVFGKAVDDGPVPVVSGDHPNLLCGYDQPRPLGFIWAMPMWAIRVIGGYDEAFMDGIAFEDDDIVWRLWRLGLPFVFTDQISGVHQHHHRPFLTEQGIAPDNRNERLMIAKWGHPHPWQQAPKWMARDHENRQAVCLPQSMATGLAEAWGVATESESDALNASPAQ